MVTHGLPVPVNFELACQLEDEVRNVGATPAVVAVINGTLKAGLTRTELEYLATGSDIHKAGRRDLGLMCSRGYSAGTTVSATMYIARQAGIQVFATGGIGGVHRGDSGDISADLPELQHTPVAVVCSGAKAILDLPRTVEWLETAGVPVLGWKQIPSRLSSPAPPGCRFRPEPTARTMRQRLSIHTGSWVEAACSSRCPARLMTLWEKAKLKQPWPGH